MRLTYVAKDVSAQIEQPVQSVRNRQRFSIRHMSAAGHFWAISNCQQFPTQGKYCKGHWFTLQTTLAYSVVKNDWAIFMLNCRQARDCSGVAFVSEAALPVICGSNPGAG